jgi:hypothetical protein
LKSDIEMIESIKAAAIRSIGDELAFSFPQVLDLIKHCSINDIAVLGVDVHKDREGPIETVHLSGYEVPDSLGIKDWKSYVQTNNSLAETFIRQRPTDAELFYLLAATSWREFVQIQAMKRAMKRQ